MYRESPTAVYERKERGPHVLMKLFNSMFLFLYFIFLPVMLTVLINWAVYSLTKENFYQDHWMMPTLLLLSTFLAGALMRQKMEDESGGQTGGMGLFFLGIAALFAFVWLTQQDIQMTGRIYSHWLPTPLRPSVSDWLLMLPLTGIFGMLFYKFFTLKHYS